MHKKSAKRQKLPEAILCEKHAKGYARLKKAKAAISNYVQEACEGVHEEAAKKKRRMLPEAAVCGKTAKAKSCQK